MTKQNKLSNCLWAARIEPGHLEPFFPMAVNEIDIKYGRKEGEFEELLHGFKGLK